MLPASFFRVLSVHLRTWGWFTGRLVQEREEVAPADDRGLLVPSLPDHVGDEVERQAVPECEVEVCQRDELGRPGPRQLASTRHRSAPLAFRARNSDVARPARSASATGSAGFLRISERAT